MNKISLICLLKIPIIHSFLHCQFVGYKLIIQICTLQVVIIQQYKNQHQNIWEENSLRIDINV